MSTWSGIRNKLENDYLCPALRGRIQYFATSYSKSADHEGRAAMRMDGVEVLRSNYYTYFENVWTKFHHLRSVTLKDCDSAKEAINQAHAFALEQGTFDQRCSMRRLVSLTIRALGKAWSVRIRLSASLPSWIEGWESAACWLWRTPWSRNWTGCGLSM